MQVPSPLHRSHIFKMFQVFLDTSDTSRCQVWVTAWLLWIVRLSKEVGYTSGTAAPLRSTVTMAWVANVPHLQRNMALNRGSILLLVHTSAVLFWTCHGKQADFDINFVCTETKPKGRGSVWKAKPIGDLDFDLQLHRRGWAGTHCWWKRGARNSKL